jgi:hypothetical protein
VADPPALMSSLLRSAASPALYVGRSATAFHLLLGEGSSYFAFRLVLCDATQSHLSCHAVEVVRVELGAHGGNPAACNAHGKPL